MKTFQKFTSIGCMIAVFMAFGSMAKAQTATVNVTNNTGCALDVAFAGDYGSVTCGTKEAEGQILSLAPGFSSNVAFVDSKYGTLTSAFLRVGMASVVSNPTGSNHGQSASCLSPAITGSSGVSGCSANGFTVTVTVTGAGQFISIDDI